MLPKFIASMIGLSGLIFILIGTNNMMNSTFETFKRNKNISDRLYITGFSLIAIWMFYLTCIND